MIAGAITWRPSAAIQALAGEASTAIHSFPRQPIRRYLPSFTNEEARTALPDQANHYLLQQVQQCLRLAGSIEFDSGMDNPLREVLPVLVRQLGAPFVELLSTHIRQGKVAPYVAAELLHYFGDIDHPATFASRTAALMEGLRHPSAIVRDGAVLGIMLLDHTVMVPALRQALAHERVPQLQSDMGYLLNRFERLQPFLR